MAGHVRRRGDRWQARYPDPLKAGTSKIEKTFRTKRDAERWLSQQQASVHAGVHVDPRSGERRFAELAAELRRTWADLEPKTRLGYESILGSLEKEFGGARIASLSPDVLQDWANALAERRARNTVRRHYTVLRSVMALAVERRYLAVNPCDAVKLPRQRGDALREMLFLSDSEVGALADAIDPRYRVLIYVVAAYTGLRAGELGGLRRKRVDLLRGEIHVTEALKEVGGRLDFGVPKSAASRRKLKIGSQLRAMLQEHLSRPSPGGTGPDALVFTTPTGKPIRHNLFYKRVFRPAVERELPADKQGLRFHDLRRTCAALAVERGAHPQLIKGRLGHEDIRTTLNTYGHLFPSQEAALADSLDAGLVVPAPPPMQVLSLPTDA